MSRLPYLQGHLPRILCMIPFSLLYDSIVILQGRGTYLPEDPEHPW